MAKYSFSDIRPAGRRKKTKPEIPIKEEVKNLIEWKPVSSSNNTIEGVQSPRKVSRSIIWGIATLTVFFLFISIFNLFYGALIKVTPKIQDSLIDGMFSAYKNVTDDNVLSFQIMMLSSEETKEVPASLEKEVNRKASGTIVVYNEYSSKSQKLVKNTRFEAPDGKIYRIKTSIVVPGTRVDSGEIIPGSVEAVVYADEPGEGYNYGFSDFTIPGFKNSPQYEKFYARSKTEMTGGFSGILKYPSDEDLEKARDELGTQLKESLFEKAHAQKPEGFVLYENAMFFELNEPGEIEETTGKTVDVIREGKFYGVLFNKIELSKFIASRALSSFDGEEVIVTNIEDLNFSITGNNLVTSLDEKIEFSLTGNVNIVWVVDEDLLKERLVGVPKKNFQEILSEFPYIERAKANLRPFWKRSFPDETKYIKVEQNI